MSNNEHLLVLDSGDFLHGSSENDKLKAKFILRGYKKIKYDAINLGERDFSQGVKYLLKAKKKYKLPFISANIFYQDSTTLFTKPYIIKKFKAKKYGDVKIKPLKVGIFGVMLLRYPLSYDPNDPKLIVKDPIKIAQQVVAKLKDECDVIIALAHLNTHQINELITKVPGIDLVIGGHDYPKKARWASNNVYLVQTGYKGQNIADVDIIFDDNKNITDINGKLVRLDSKIQFDSSFQELLLEYDREYHKLIEKKDH